MGGDDRFLRFAANEKFTVIDSSGNWWHVRNAAGKEGRVPQNYMKMEPGMVSL